MSKQPNALAMAAWLEAEAPTGDSPERVIAAELRRQNEVIAELVEALRLMLEGTKEDCGSIRMPNDNAVRAAFKAIAKAEAA